MCDFRMLAIEKHNVTRERVNSEVGRESCFTICGEITLTWLPSSKSTGTGWFEIRAIEVSKCLR